MIRRLDAATTRPRASTSTRIEPEYFRMAACGSGGIHLGSGRTTATAGSYATGSLAVTRIAPAAALDVTAGAAAGAGSTDTGIDGGSGAATIERVVGTIGGGGA